MNQKLKNISAVIILVVLIITALVFYFFNPEEVLFFPSCPFLLITGYECPGCGTQRAIHSLLHLNIIDAFRYNALIVFLIPYVLLGFYLDFLNGKKRWPRLEHLFFGMWSARVVIGAIFVYWLLRNIL